MATLVRVEGFEHGVMSISGGGLASTLTYTGSNMTVDGAVKRTGDYSLKISPAANTCYWEFPTIATATVVVGTVYVYFTSWNAVDNDIIWCRMAAGLVPALKIRAATHRIYARFWSGTDGTTWRWLQGTAAV